MDDQHAALFWLAIGLGIGAVTNGASVLWSVVLIVIGSLGVANSAVAARRRRRPAPPLS